MRTRGIWPFLFVTACAPGDADGQRTLDNCGGSVASDVPVFFARYFDCATVTLEGDEVVVHTIDLPPHPSPYYPEGDPNHEVFDDRGGEYHQNPNTLVEQDVTLRIPLDPVATGAVATTGNVDRQAGNSPDEYAGGPVGVALDGVALFSGVAAPGDDIADERFTFDTWEGHPAPGGAYHHHTAAPGPLAVLADRGLDDGREVYGILCDGTVVLGCTELDGSAVDAGAVDAQGGHVHDLSDDSGLLFSARYHTHVCETTTAYTPEIRTRSGC